jgi:hypothetical protein
LTVEESKAGPGGYLMLAADDSSMQRSESGDGKQPPAGESAEPKLSVPDAGDAPKPLKPEAPAQQFPRSALSSPARDKSAAPVLSAAIKPVPVAAANSGTIPGQAPSLIQRLEGREGDLVVWLGIAAVFFLAGWIGGVIFARRRERARRGRLRF